MEEEYHKENCPDRRIVDLFMYKRSESGVCFQAPKKVDMKSICLDEEDWESEAHSSELKSYDPQKKCENSNVLRRLQGATPSER